MASPMKLKINIPVNGLTVKIPLIYSSGTPVITVSWGGTGTVNPSDPLSYTYTYSGIYNIEVNVNTVLLGTYGSTLSVYSTFNQNITEVVSWGTGLNIKSCNSAFYNASPNVSKLIAVANDLPSGVTDMSYMFYNCSLFNQSLSFNTTSVTTMSFMFYGCKVFNSIIPFNTTT